MTNNNLILHITKLDAWMNAVEGTEYRGDTLESEGFIHCSTEPQLIQVANRWFAGQSDLVLLLINEQAVVSPIHYENLEGGEEQYPHIYGPLNINAVIAAFEFESTEQAGFDFPEMYYTLSQSKIKS